MRPKFLDLQKRKAQVNAFLLGGYAGVVAALILAILTALAVEHYNAKSAEQSRIALNAEYEQDIKDCKAIVTRLSQSDYENVLSIYRQREGR